MSPIDKLNVEFNLGQDETFIKDGRVYRKTGKHENGEPKYEDISEEL
jgi:hypothetical protein